VKRDGKWINPPARELVPGDIIRLRLGDIVPADARLLDGDPVEVDQSALTESRCPQRNRATRYSPVRLSARAKLAQWSMPRGEHLLRQDGAISAGGTYRQPFKRPF